MQFKEGDIVEGKITGITKFGAFADIGNGVSGMVHISEISRTYVNNISDYVKVGDSAKMKIISVGDDGRIALSMSKVLSDKPVQRVDRRPREHRKSAKPDGSFVWEAEVESPATFEEMMSKFKKRSDEKISDLKRKSPEARRTKRTAPGR
ncbi:MAG: S1 RNA-binding domain-containing protein [Clostridia bacterium]|nr:S1 RNA-binding domain-containing protein [Clostridia bacterium]